VKIVRPGTPDPGRFTRWRPACALGRGRGGFVNHKRLWQRALIVAAGPAANFLFAIVLTAIVFATVGQQLTATVIGEVVQDSAAAAAGLKPGDKVLTANGQQIQRFEDLAALVSVGLGEPLKLQVQRGGQVIDLEAQPKIIE